MSALPVEAPRPLRRPAPQRPRLEVAPTRVQRRARPRLVHAVITMAGIGVILMAQLLLSIVLADGAYQISALQSQQRDLLRQQEALAENLEILSSTQNLIANAERMGMVASGNPVFLDLATGAVSGNASAAGGSLTGGQGNLIGNALVTSSMVIDPNVERPATDSGGPATTSPGSTAPGTLPSPTTR
jgi:hypothetical protein